MTNDYQYQLSMLSRTPLTDVEEGGRRLLSPTVFAKLKIL